jgi:hypothetical protein
MGVPFVATFQAVAVTVAQDLFEITFPSTIAGRLLEVEITQSSEVADAQAEMLRFAIKRGTSATTSGSAGSTPTAVSVVPGMTFTGVVEANNTARISGGTVTVLEEVDKHVAEGFHHLPPLDRCYEFAGSQRCVIGLEAAPADSVTISGKVVFETLGGI